MRERVDLRSDTVTLPSPAMRQAMANAEVGDDVYGEDPTVRRLEELAAERVGHAAALFVPSGTMGNQIAINLLSKPGTEVLLEQTCHVFLYELAAMAVFSGVQPRVLRGVDGQPGPQAIEAAINPPIYYDTRASMLVLENSHNYAGGTVSAPAQQAERIAAARRHGLGVHLDGARIFNAAVGLGVEPAALTRDVDSVMFCLSKGLGAPAGSLLCGSREWIEEARVVRKRMGGGMRQVGVLAAAGLVALEQNVERLGQDHRRARRLAREMAGLKGLVIDPERVATNIVIAEVEPRSRLQTWIDGLTAEGVLAGDLGPGRLRLVTHLDIDDAGLDRAVAALRQVAARV